MSITHATPCFRALSTTHCGSGAGLMLSAALFPAIAAATCPSDNICMTIEVDNQNSSVPSDGNSLYLTLFAAGGPTTLVKPDGSTFSTATSVAFDTLVPTGGTSAQIDIQTSAESPLASGRLYFSESALGPNPPTPNADFRYDYVEFTVTTGQTVNGDVTGIDQVGIPAQLAFQDADGNTLNEAGNSNPATRTMGCWNDIYATVSNAATPLASKWDASGIVQDMAGTNDRKRLAGPGAMPGGYADYPSMQAYILSLHGPDKTVTISGYFAGNGDDNPATYYNYSGSFDSYGNLALSGSLTSDRAGSTANPGYPDPQTIYLPAKGFFATLGGTSWHAGDAYGTGFGIYAQNGPYQLGGSAPTDSDGDGSWEYTQDNGTLYVSIGNDVYGWIYGDLVASLANGFIGPLGYDSSAWNTNRDGNGNQYAEPQPAFAAAYAAKDLALPTYAAWDFWQQAISTTSDSYGVSLGDRFEFQGAASSSPDMATDKPTGIIKVTLLANDGC